MIELHAVSHSYRSNSGDVPVFEQFSLNIGMDRLTTVAGPSGCGKSTLLRLIAGLELPRSGSVMVNGKPSAIGENGVAMVFQQHSLLPWMTTVNNVLLGMKLGTRKDRYHRAMDLLDQFGLADVSMRYPHELSGGMAQRVSLARSLAIEPKILLMDEPFSALDERLRRELQDELLKIKSEQSVTIIYVTHSMDEAVYLSDRIVVLPERGGADFSELLIPVTHPRDRQSEPFEKALVALHRKLFN